MRSLTGSGSFALDSESDNFQHYFEKVCLLQVAGPEGQVWFVDPLALPDLSALKPLLAEAGTEKILHGAQNDIATLKRDFGFEWASVFDTQLAARFCGDQETGLQALLWRELGIRHLKSKRIQRTDWSRRPLTPAEELYASGDVRHLAALRDRMKSRLHALGRMSWLREECDEMVRLPPSAPREPADYSEAKGAQRLSPRGRAVLLELFRLRERWAQEADLPLFKVVSDETLVTLAGRRPHDRSLLGHTPGLSARLRGRAAGDLLAAIRRGESLPELPIPQRATSAPPRRTQSEVRRVRRLKAWRLHAAERSGLDPGFLLPQRLIDRIAIDSPESLDGLEAIPGFLRWRAATFGSEILRILRP